MQVERPQYGGQSPEPMARVHSGVELTPDQAGATKWRQIQHLAEAGQGLGQSLLHEAQQREEREDAAFTQDRIAKARLGYLERSKAIFAKQGQAAKDAPAEMDALLERLRKDAGDKLTVEQQRRFDHAWRQFAPQARAEALQHRQTQMDRFAKEADKAILMAMGEEAKAKGRDAGENGVAAVLAGRYSDLVRDKTRAMFEDAPDAVRDQAVRDNVRAFHLGQVGSFIDSSPRNALVYLEKSDMKDSLDESQYEALHQHLTAVATEAEQKAIVDAGVGRAVSRARRGVTPSKVFAELVKKVGTQAAVKAAAGSPLFAPVAAGYAIGPKLAVPLAAGAAVGEAGDAAPEKSPDRDAAGATGESAPALRDKGDAEFFGKYARITLDAYAATVKTMRTEQVVQAVGRDRALENELAAAGNDATRMASWNSLSVDDKETWLEKGKKVALRAGAKPEPSISKYLDYKTFTDDQLLDVFTNPQTREQAAADLGGGDSPWFKRVFSRLDPAARAETAREKGADDVDAMLAAIRKEAFRVDSTGGVITKGRRRRLDAVLKNTLEDVAAAQRKFAVDTPDTLPPEERERIVAKNLLGFIADEHGRDADQRNRRGTVATLPRAAREHYVPGANIVAQPGAEGTVYLITDIPRDALPEAVRLEQERTGAQTVRDAHTGQWLVIDPKGHAARAFSPDGKESLGIRQDAGIRGHDRMARQ